MTDFVKSSLADRERPIAAKARAQLIESTFKALSGFSEEAKTTFLAVGEEMYASRRVRVNALIKAACLAMTVDQLDEALNDLNMAVKLQPDFSVALVSWLCNRVFAAT
ncbi:unnamed protein product [Dibothriocephalus latus]|uniref:Uncharacterized protein n=1 Tax=Dibothriocephalus latus TaxID=60516 RepID=A0A3P7N5L0_DIBLA|nr:unnamed protein product [Dibothriocephalus latus]